MAKVDFTMITTDDAMIFHGHAETGDYFDWSPRVGALINPANNDEVERNGCTVAVTGRMVGRTPGMVDDVRSAVGQEITAPFVFNATQRFTATEPTEWVCVNMKPDADGTLTGWRWEQVFLADGETYTPPVYAAGKHKLFVVNGQLSEHQARTMLTISNAPATLTATGATRLIRLWKETV